MTNKIKEQDIKDLLISGVKPDKTRNKKSPKTKKQIDKYIDTLKARR